MKKLTNIKKKLIKEIKSKKTLRKVKNDAKHVNFEQIVNDLKSFNVNRGDIEFVYSSLKSIGYVQNGPNTVIKAFLKVLGSEGTLIIPTYTMRGNMYNTCI